jgi:hypothetical protein
MGLDMYLYKKTYVKNWDHMKEEERHEVTVKKNGQPVQSIKPERVSEVVEEVGYWRKANAIHQWFVDNVQDGKDDCASYYVSKEQLKELLGIVNQVLAGTKTKPGLVRNGRRYENGTWTDLMEEGEKNVNPELAAELLPTASGFFFGGTDYDEYYIEDLKETKRILEEALQEVGPGSFEYQSSW